jgi:2-hydroxycyclohexanecarboxyl-CoA dehydrogenase
MGLSICEHLADRGNKIAVLDLNGDAAQKVADDLRSAGHDALGAAVDVSDRAAVDDAMQKVRSEFGPIEILVTSAGISNFVKFMDLTIDQWNRMLAVNLTGTFHCVQSAIPDMIEARWGRIVLISSSSAQTGAPRMAHYVSSKGGVIGLMRALAREFAPVGITVNTIPPSSIDTPMAREQQDLGNLPDHEAWAARIPVGRVGTGDDIAAACTFLCSDEASYVTGQVIGVNGGAVP